jgi:hypothetical protein
MATDVTITMPRRRANLVAALIAAATHLDPDELGLPAHTNLDHLDPAYEDFRTALDARDDKPRLRASLRTPAPWERQEAAG